MSTDVCPRCGGNHTYAARAVLCYEEKEFTCPRCGSHRFGSGLEHGALRRHCEGERRCHFTWFQCDDDQVMKGTGRFHPLIHVAQGFG